MHAPVTALIPCRDARPWLAEAIASVRAQTRPADELIVVDDASTDGSAELAASLGATVLTTPTAGGVAVARNLGLAAARHELVALLDADDAWLPHHLARAVPLIASSPDVAAAFGAVQVTPDASPLARVVGARINVPWIDEGRPQRLFERCLVYWIGQPTSCVLRRSAALAVGGFDQAMAPAEDFDLWLRLSRDHAFAATHEVTALWRRHAAQASNRLGLQLERCFASRAAVWHALVAHGELERARRAGTIIRDAYEAALTTARERTDVERLLAFAELVPGGPSIRARWRRRLALPGPLGAWWLRDGRRLEARVRGSIYRAARRLGRV